MGYKIGRQSTEKRPTAMNGEPSEPRSGERSTERGVVPDADSTRFRPSLSTDLVGAVPGLPRRVPGPPGGDDITKPATGFQTCEAGSVGPKAQSAQRAVRPLDSLSHLRGCRHATRGPRTGARHTADAKPSTEAGYHFLVGSLCLGGHRHRLIRFSKDKSG